MAFQIEISDLAESELKAIRVFERRTIVDQIKAQLSHQPMTATRNRKRLETAAASFEHVPPIWELRVDAWRVFYDVDDTNKTVCVRAVRKKEQGQTTEDII